MCRQMHRQSALSPNHRPWAWLGTAMVAMIGVLGASASGQQPVVQLSPVAPQPFENAAHQAAPNDDQIRRVAEDVLRSHEARWAVDRREVHQPVPDEPDAVPFADLVYGRSSVGLKNGGKLQIYGFGRGDLIFADSRLSNTVVPFFVLSEDPASPTPVPDDDAQFNANVRLTRLGFEYNGTRANWLGCSELSAKIEIDFETLLNITSESRAVPRIRHAYGKMKWGEFSLLLGQTWDPISPLNPMINDDSLMWNAGNLGDRRPQLRADWDHDLGCDRRLIIATALSSGGAIDHQDLDGNGLKDGEDSAIPAVQQRIGYRFPTWFNYRTAELGMSWLVSFESVDTPVGGESDFVSRGVGLDWSLPLFQCVTWRGEAWYGRDLSDWRGGHCSRSQHDHRRRDRIKRRLDRAAIRTVPVVSSRGGAHGRRPRR